MKRSFTSMTTATTPMVIDGSKPFLALKRKASIPKGPKLSKRQKLEVVKTIHRNQELKWFGTPISAQEIPGNPGLLTLITGIAQGTTDQQRTGDRIKYAGSIFLRMVIDLGDAAADTHVYIRTICFQWHPNSVPAAGNILINGPTGSPDILSVYNHDGRQMYTIMFDKTEKLIGNQNVAAAPNVLTSSTIPNLRTYSIKLAPITFSTTPFESQAQFSAGGVTATNHIYILQLSDTTGGVGHRPFTSWYTKVVWRDS